jgi:putative SOS response-associated peptidase YedK
MDGKNAEDEDLVIKPMRWGLVPFYTKAETVEDACKAGNIMINARQDFRPSFQVHW